MTARKILTSAAASIVAAGALTAMTGTAAQASATNCVLAGLGQVCNATVGQGTHVELIRAQRSNGAGQICGYSARVHIDDPAGNEVFTADTGVVDAGACVIGAAYIDFPVNRSFPDGSTTYVEWFEGGQKVGGTPANQIKG